MSPQGYQNAPWQINSAALDNLYLDAYHACDGFTYNITRRPNKKGQKTFLPGFEELKLASASQWSVLARHLVEDLLDQEKHPKGWKKYNFFMSTLGIPDESYIPTFAINSFHTIHNSGIHFLKAFSGKDAYSLCRYNAFYRPNVI